MQTSVMFSPCSKTQSLRTFRPAANLQPSLSQLQSYQTIHFPNSPSSCLPQPLATWFTSTYISLTARQCSCFWPRHVLPLSNDCSILVRSLLYIAPIAPLSIAHEEYTVFQLLSSESCISLSPPFSSQKLANVLLCFSLSLASSPQQPAWIPAAFHFVPNAKMVRLHPAGTDGGTACG